ncbi:hypothetical protein OG429_40295 (plasmid) [Streptomyces sp. NBC_00190]|uniref:hypothetical protein n=1 Tax=unclassified Streptomyces TaxID=2593676 RepID=UPI002E2DF28F|nr:hypothetical protein [Streptomyces sp. NBC_00190]WSZ45793.1 hypothetical protein OG239_44320 [Streptomyces sp. NBC_00868]
MTHNDATPQTPDPVRPPTQPEPPAPPAAPRNGTHDTFVLIALLGTCAGVYLAVGEAGFAGVISAVAGLYGTWRMRH